jgi:hypothetical protein
MKIRNITLVFASAFLSLVAMQLAASAQTIDPPRKFYYMSGMTYIARGEAVGIHFCNVNPEVREVKLYILDANGKTLKSASGRVMPGETQGISFSFNELPRTSPIRVGVRGVAVLADPPSEADPPDPDADPPTELGLVSMNVADVLTGRVSFSLLVPAVKSLKVYFPTDQ